MTRVAANTPTVTDNPAPRPPSPSPVDPNVAIDAKLAELDRLMNSEDRVPTEADAARATRELNALGRLTQPDQQVLAALIRAAIFGVRNDAEAACQVVRGVEPQSLNTRYATQVRTFLRVAQCP